MQAHSLVSFHLAVWSWLIDERMWKSICNELNVIVGMNEWMSLRICLFISSGENWGQSWKTQGRVKLILCLRFRVCACSLWRVWEGTSVSDRTGGSIVSQDISSTVRGLCMEDRKERWRSARYRDREGETVCLNPRPMMHWKISAYSMSFQIVHTSLIKMS